MSPYPQWEHSIEQQVKPSFTIVYTISALTIQLFLLVETNRLRGEGCTWRTRHKKPPWTNFKVQILGVFLNFSPVLRHLSYTLISCSIKAGNWFYWCGWLVINMWPVSSSVWRITNLIWNQICSFNLHSFMLQLEKNTQVSDNIISHLFQCYAGLVCFALTSERPWLWTHDYHNSLAVRAITAVQCGHLRPNENTKVFRL